MPLSGFKAFRVNLTLGHCQMRLPFWAYLLREVAWIIKRLLKIPQTEPDIRISNSLNLRARPNRENQVYSLPREIDTIYLLPPAHKSSTSLAPTNFNDAILDRCNSVAYSVRRNFLARCEKQLQSHVNKQLLVETNIPPLPKLYKIPWIETSVARLRNF